MRLFGYMVIRPHAHLHSAPSPRHPLLAPHRPQAVTIRCSYYSWIGSTKNEIILHSPADYLTYRTKAVLTRVVPHVIVTSANANAACRQLEKKTK